MKRLLTALLLTLLVGVSLRAEKWALLVGINNYPNDISSLKYCVADVVAFRDALVNVAGFKKEKIFLMTDGMEGQMEPTHVNVIMRLDILAKQIQPQDTLVFYFSGHGISRQDQSFLLAANSVTTTPNTLELTAIPLQKVNQILSRVKGQQLLSIIDACRNNPDSGRGDKDNYLTDDFSKGFKVKRSSSSGGQPSVSATLYACNVGERAYEWAEKGHGVFSYYLLEGLNGEAVNSQGEVTVTTLAEYTRGNVVKWAEEFRGKKQTPSLSLQGGAKLVLAEGVGHSPPPVTINPTATDPESEAWEVVKDSTNVLDIKDFLVAFPNGKLAVVAGLKIKRLERSAEPDKPSSQQQQAEQAQTQQLKETEQTNDTVTPVKSGKKEDQLQEEARRAKAKEELERQSQKARPPQSKPKMSKPKLQPEMNPTRDQQPTEVEMWERVKLSTNIADIENFLSLFPNSKLAGVAKFKLKKLLRPKQSDRQQQAALKVRDGAKMVLIPAGPSTSSFYMDMYEVTNAQYRKFVRATGHREPQYWHNSEYNQPNQPVIGVSWHDATAYAKWAGKRLPSEAEWEYAARGGLAGQRYVWGDETPTAERANYGSNVGKPTAVGSYPANGYGLYDMAGNVGEWCQDWYNSDRKYRVLRGGRWSTVANSLRVALRDYYDPNNGSSFNGFRCVSGSP